MCRSIKTLRRPGEAATADEVSAAALQFVRKISGFRKPSKANQDAFERAVREIAGASERLLETLAPAPRARPAPPSEGSGVSSLPANPAARGSGGG